MKAVKEAEAQIRSTCSKTFSVVRVEALKLSLVLYIDRYTC